MIEEAGIIYQPNMINPKVLTENLSDYLFNYFLQSWSQVVNRGNARQGVGKNNQRTYKTFKNVYYTENYLNYIMSRCHKSAYAKFRCGVAPIRIETGRYERLPYGQKILF